MKEDYDYQGTNLIISEDSIELSDELPYGDNDICYQQRILHSHLHGVFQPCKCKRAKKKNFTGEKISYRMTMSGTDAGRSHYDIRDCNHEKRFLAVAAQLGFLEDGDDVWITTRQNPLTKERKIIAIHFWKPDHWTDFKKD